MKETLLTEIAFEDADYSVFDFETTGTSAKYEKVIEIGIVKIHKGKISDSFSSFINPGKPIPYFITQMTGITNFDVENAPFFDEVYKKIKDFVGDSILTAHNLKFDHSFLRHECINNDLQMLSNESICTLQLARRMYPHFPSKSLGNLVKQLRIRHRDVHRGLGDATATAKILLRMFKTLREEHQIDSVSDLINFQKQITSSQPFLMVKKKLLEDTANIPEQPGVYFFKNAKGDIIYIGKAKSLKSRLKSYFMSNAMRKSKEIVRKASGLGFQITNTELTALISEAELIKKHLPKQNTLLKKYPKSYFVKIYSFKKYPTVEVTSTFYFDGNNYFGPYANRDTANSLREIVDKTFQLRECTDKEFNKKRKCYLADIERCLAPCIESDIDLSYTKELQNAADFLCGQNQSAVDRLLGKMKELSAKHKFEEAALVRDVVQLILNQLSKASILSESINNACVLIEILGFYKNDYMLLVEGKIFFKDNFLGGQSEFENRLNDYFNSTVQIQNELTEKDLEQLRIALSWLVKNKNKIKVHYLKNFSSIEDLNASLIFPAQKQN